MVDKLRTGRNVLVLHHSLRLFAPNTVTFERVQDIGLASSDIIFGSCDQILKIYVGTLEVCWVDLEARGHAGLAHHVSVLDVRFHLGVASLAVVRHVEVVLGKHEAMVLANLNSVGEVLGIVDGLVADDWLHHALFHGHLVRVVGIGMELGHSFI